jgi:hypothetical protein
MPSAVGLLIVALGGSSAASLSAGDLLAHGSVVWVVNLITFGLLFWHLDGADRACAPSAGDRTPTLSSPRTPEGAPAGAHG